MKDDGMNVQLPKQNVREVDKRIAKPVVEEAREVKQTKVSVIASKRAVETVDTDLVDEVCSNEQFAHAEGGSASNEEKVSFSFIRDYGEEDITDTLKDVLKKSK